MSVLNLDNARYLNLATYRRNGTAVNTPVWFAADDGSYYLFSASKAGKMKRLRNSSAARIAPCDVRGTLLGDWIDARAHRVESVEEERKAYRLLIKKYGWQMRVTNFFSRLTGRINHRSVILVRPSVGQ
jgi:PPOX class probable F420-dependent enzyme